MALHQDIYWLGRQWAVTGSGMQVLNQRLHGQFDIDVIRLWDADLPEQVGGHEWLNVDDFTKGLEIARAQFPGTPEQVARVEARQAELKAKLPVDPPKRSVEPPTPPADPPKLSVTPPKSPIDPPKPSPNPPQPSAALPKERLPPVNRPFALRAERWPAKLVAMWHVRVRLKGDQP